MSAQVTEILDLLDESFVQSAKRLEPTEPDYYARLDRIMVDRAAIRARYEYVAAVLE